MSADAETSLSAPPPSLDRQQRWRLVLGDEADASCGKPSGTALEMDRALAALYDADGPGRGGSARVGGSGRGAPTVVRTLLSDYHHRWSGGVVDSLALS